VPPPFTDNPQKCVVRELWDTPLLCYFHTRYGVRYRYFGLPGVDLIDVRLWRDMIDEVVAFEPPGSDGGRRAAIDALRSNMKKYGIRGTAYWGSFEEVVLLRKDYDGVDYRQNSVVTLYNLDFCDEISSPISTRERGRKVRRFEAIRHVLRDQVECFQREGGPQHFVLMLTVRSQINADKIKSFLTPGTMQGDAKRFREECSKILAIPDGRSPLVGTHSWALKTLLFNSLSSYFGNPNISAVFFPQLMYQGTKTRIPRAGGGIDYLASPMLHWLVLCRFGDMETPTASCFPLQYLWSASVEVDGRANALRWAPQTGEVAQGAGLPDSVAWLKRFGGSVLAGLREGVGTRARQL